MSIRRNQLVFVHGQNNYPVQMSYKDAVMDNRFIISCSYCEEPAEKLDIMFPHASDYNVCGNHVEFAGVISAFD